MNSNLLTLIVSTGGFLTALMIRFALSVEGSPYLRYYIWAALTISAILMVVSLIRLIRAPYSFTRRTMTNEGKGATERRDNYRLVFDEPPRPVFIQKEDGPGSVPVFSCPVWDVSESGISLLCLGAYASGDVVQGEIIFDSGRTAPINGVATRATGNRTGVRLHCTIDPPLLMVEQRELITRLKNSGPRPAVGRAFLDAKNRSLPSHQPKGVCRLKRS